MHRPPDIETIQDFHQYYRGSVIGMLNEDGLGYSPILISQAAGNSVVYNVENDTKHITFDRLLGLAQFGAPQYGSAEIGESAVYVSRRSARTANRGHRPNGLRCHRFHTDEMGREILSSWEYYRALFNPKYRGIRDSFNLLSKGERLACSLSRHFTLAQVEGYVVPCLYYRTDVVGYVPNAYRIELENQEHALLVREAFQNVEVV